MNVDFLIPTIVSFMGLSLALAVVLIGNEGSVYPHLVAQIPIPLRGAFVKRLGRGFAVVCGGACLLMLDRLFPALAIIEIPALVVTVAGAALVLVTMAGVGLVPRSPKGR